MNIIHSILCLPFWMTGLVTGYFSRSFLAGWYTGFYYIEAKERNALIAQLSKEIQESKDGMQMPS